MNFNLTSLLDILKKLPKIDLSKYHAVLGLVVPLLPEKVKIKGRAVNLRATIAAAVADDDIDNDDIFAFVVAWVSAEVDPTLPKPSLPPSIPPVPYNPPEPPPVIVTPGSIYPNALAITLHNMSLGDDDIPFEVRDDGRGCLQVYRTDGVDSITGRTKLYLGAGYFNEKGEINFERDNALHLYYSAVWEVVSENGRGSDVLYSTTLGAQPPNGHVQRSENGVVNWRMAEGQRTGLMDVPFIVIEPPAGAARPQYLRARLGVQTPTGQVRAVELRLPPVR